MNRYLLPMILGGLALLATFGDGIANQWGGLTGGAAGVTAQQNTNAGGNGAIQDPVGQAGQLVQRQGSQVATGQTTPGADPGTGAAPTNANGQQTQLQPPQPQQTPQQPQQPQPAQAPVGAPPPPNLEAIPALW